MWRQGKLWYQKGVEMMKEMLFEVAFGLNMTNSGAKLANRVT